VARESIKICDQVWAMVCLGTAQMSPGRLQSEAAQLHVMSWFRDDFLRRFPNGEVISELEYMGRTTTASGSPTPLRTFGRPRLNKVLDALAHDFRRWARNGDYRKCDVLGLANDGRSAELVEVTTEGNKMSAVIQLTSKLAILRETVNRIHNLSVDWKPSQWRPSSTQLFRVLPSRSTDVVYICYVPTFRAAAPPGVVLYEIHALSRQRAQVPVPAPEGAKQRVRQVLPGNQESLDSRAREFLAKNPDVAGWIRAIAAVLAVAAVIAAIIALIDPIPGDEVAAAGLASALFRFATSR
jgi:hypothetical protein